MLVTVDIMISSKYEEQHHTLTHSAIYSMATIQTKLLMRPPPAIRRHLA